jgi:hypothetical protein
VRSTRPTLPPSEPSPSPWPSRSRPHSCPQQSSRRALGWRLGGQRVPRELPPLDGQILDARGLVSVPFITARMATEPKPNPPLDSRAGRYALEGVPPSVVRADAWVSDPSDLTHSDSLSLDFAQGRLVGLVGSSSTFLRAPGFIEQAGPFFPLDWANETNLCSIRCSWSGTVLAVFPFTSPASRKRRSGELPTTGGHAGRSWRCPALRPAFSQKTAATGPPAG